MLASVARTVGAGELPLVLSPTPIWQPRDARQAFETVVRLECRRLGWADRAGRMDPEVSATLGILCRPQVAFYGWIRRLEGDGDRTVQHVIGVQASAIGKRGLLAVRDGDSVWLSQISHGKLPERLVAQAPDVAAGTGQPLLVAADELAGLTSDGRHRASGGVMTRRANTQARTLQRLMELPQLGAGELHVAVRDHVGRRHACANPIRYIDSTGGRYRYERRVANGQAHLAVVPATRQNLADLLREARQSLLASP